MINSTTVAELIFLQVWQVSLLFVVIAVATRLVGKRWPHLTLLLWCIFFVKCVAPPILESPVSVLAWATPDFSEWTDATRGADVSPTFGNAPRNDLDPLLNVDVVADGGSALLHQQVWRTRGQLAIVILWALGACGLLAWSVFRYFKVVRRVEQDLGGADPVKCVEVQEELSQKLYQLGWRSHDVRLVVSSSYSQPFVFGVWKPVLVIPASFCNDQAMVQTVVAHELCHLWRRDQILGWLQLLAKSLLWFHPFVWIASRMTNFWCEVCCDDDALRMFSLSSTKYARGLVAAMEHRPACALPATPGLSAFLLTQRRLSMILNRPHSGLFRATNQISACLLLLLAIPTLQSPDGRYGISPLFESDQAELASIESVSRLVGAPSEMDFLIGHWSLVRVDPSGMSQPAGSSEFEVEQSRKMIRENWTATNGDTAQGITFYDPARQAWRMTWVGSSGAISETSGTWNGRLLTLNGELVLPSGARHPVTTRIERRSMNEFRTQTIVGRNQQPDEVGSIIYRRRMP